jgi:hypothetical protein
MRRLAFSFPSLQEETAMSETVLFAFKGEPMCFVHVLLNSLNMAAQGLGGKIVLEGEAVKLVPEMAKPEHFLHQLYTEAKGKGLILGACRACSAKLGVAEEIEAEDIQLIGTMSGHPAMADYITQGYSVITF